MEKNSDLAYGKNEQFFRKAFKTWVPTKLFKF